MIDAELLKILCCPETRQPLSAADETTVARVNEGIRSGASKNRAGKTVKEPCDGGLVRRDGTVFYPIRQGIPILLIAESITI